ncbi:MAG: hypothetical protein GY868_19050, partial [Deltaproteobacteria bacterium]|nr:hypothetical protein [Deltaproteobacteria bacterium]
MPRLQESAQSGRPVFLLSAFLLFGIFLSLMTFGAIQLQAIRIPFVHAQDKGDSALEGSADPYLTAEDMQQLFDERYFYQKTPAQSFTAFLPDGPVTVKTTIDNALQKRMADLFARYRPLIAAGVVLDADTGAVLAMVNYIKNNEGRRLIPEGEANLCLNPGFPAASLIKIVTAAAVIEKKGFESSKTLPISGREHTLYKHQLGLKRQRFRARSITLENAFSRSINPYFGKLGITYLARDEFG